MSPGKHLKCGVCSVPCEAYDTPNASADSLENLPHAQAMSFALPFMQLSKNRCSPDGDLLV
jgi:hypothetical protein